MAQVPVNMPATAWNPRPYKGNTLVDTGSRNNPGMNGFSEEEKDALKVDFIEILAHGYTIERAAKLLGAWATIDEYHYLPGDPRGTRREGPHPSYGRAVPSHKTFYHWRKDDPDFDEAWTEAITVRGTNALEDLAVDLSYEGDSKMIQFLLRARDPARFANKEMQGNFIINLAPGDTAL